MQYPLKKIASLASILFAGFFFAGANNSNTNPYSNNEVIVASATSEKEAAETLFNEMDLSTMGLNMEVFTKAMDGLHKLSKRGSIKKDNIVTIVDFSQPSTQKRLYIIDVENKLVLFNTLVAHGRNSGSLLAQSFSNIPESLKSSPGFYSTAETYIGQHGLSLRLDGLEKNINHNARNRAIVMHGAPYVAPSAIYQMGFIGRSWGCPAVPMNEHKKIINTIKNGTCLFIYSPDQNYLSNSTVLNS